MHEHFFLCPYCGEQISVLLDPSIPKQTYVEDCEVCCNPMEVTVAYRGNELLSFEASQTGQ